MGYPPCKRVKESVVWLTYHEKGQTFNPISSLLTIYQSVVEPYFDYCSIVYYCSSCWNGIGDRAARVEKRIKPKARMMFKIVNGMTLRYLKDIF